MCCYRNTFARYYEIKQLCNYNHISKQGQVYKNILKIIEGFDWDCVTM